MEKHYTHIAAQERLPQAHHPENTVFCVSPIYVFLQFICEYIRFTWLYEAYGMKSEAVIKESRLNIRCGLRARLLLDKAAYSQLSVSEFVLKNALAVAEDVVQSHEAITLSEDDFAAFLQALDAQSVTNAALMRAFERHAELVRE
ncbi:MAG: DUF1778 domain-containing protein [Halothiobacillaceae bacterium]